jgi:hypothetical protein
MAELGLPAGARVVEHRVVNGRLFLKIVVEKIVVERTPTAENAHGCADGASATA